MGHPNRSHPTPDRSEWLRGVDLDHRLADREPPERVSDGGPTHEEPRRSLDVIGVVQHMRDERVTVRDYVRADQYRPRCARDEGEPVLPKLYRAPLRDADVVSLVRAESGNSNRWYCKKDWVVQSSGDDNSSRRKSNEVLLDLNPEFGAIRLRP